eukprot:3523213-Pyramimonas_sp.AAC.1
MEKLAKRDDASARGAHTSWTGLAVGAAVVRAARGEAPCTSPCSELDRRQGPIGWGVRRLVHVECRRVGCCSLPPVGTAVVGSGNGVVAVGVGVTVGDTVMGTEVGEEVGVAVVAVGTEVDGAGGGKVGE